MTARATDPLTSHLADRDVRQRSLTQRDRLLNAFISHPDGLTDEEAAVAAQLPPRSCWWKRCSELREQGLIAPVPGLTRVGTAGSKQMVSRITSPSNRSNE